MLWPGIMQTKSVVSRLIDLIIGTYFFVPFLIEICKIYSFFPVIIENMQLFEWFVFGH